LLIEEQRTNILTYSEQFDNAAWSKGLSTVTANTTSAPSGTTTADTLAASVATLANPAEIYQAQTLAINTQYAYSIFAKKNTSNFIALRHTAVSGNPYAWFNLNTGTVGTVQAGLTATITPFGNGWYRCTVVGTTPAVIGVNRVDAIVSDNDGNYVCASGGSIFIYGAQVELGSFATSYIPTVASQVTRSADVATMTGTNFSSWYNQTEGTLVFEGSTFKPTTVSPSANVGVEANDGTLNNRNVIQYLNNLAYVQTTTAGSVVAALSQAYTASATDKLAYTYKVNDFAFARNGALVGTDTSGGVPVVDRLAIGNYQSQSLLNGHIRQIAYYNTRLPNAQLQTLTAPPLVTTLSMSFTDQAYTVGV
jgi:hypothetical protein